MADRLRGSTSPASRARMRWSKETTSAGSESRNRLRRRVGRASRVEGSPGDQPSPTYPLDTAAGPLRHRAGTRPEDVYVSGGTEVVTRLDGQVLFTGSGVARLGPGETMRCPGRSRRALPCGRFDPSGPGSHACAWGGAADEASERPAAGQDAAERLSQDA